LPKKEAQGKENSFSFEKGNMSKDKERKISVLMEKRNEKKVELSIVIVNYNDKAHLESCLSSLEADAQELNLEILVVDNNSSDGSQEFIEKRFPKIKLIRNKENKGFSRANNQAIRESRGEFILFLNTDTVLLPKTIELLLEEMKRNPKAGALGPALLKGANVYQASFGRKVSFFSEVLHKCFLNPYYKLLLKIVQKKREVGWLSGACLIVRRDILDEVGLFDENFFLYFEDIDLCFRIKKRGWKLVYFPQAKIFHEGGVTTTPLKFSSRLEYRKSQLYFYQKHNSKTSLFLLRLYLGLNFSLLYFWGWLKKDKNALLRSSYFHLLKAAKEKEWKR
jgi:hypothetical protein